MLRILDLKDDREQLTTLALWHQRAWSHLNPGETLEQRINRMQTYLGETFIPSTYIAKNETLLGSAAIVASDMETRADLSPWLASVFVTAEQRNKGIGSKLISHVMSQAKNRGIKKLYLFTEDKQHYYQKLGWHVNSETTYRDHRVTIMHTFLSD